MNELRWLWPKENNSFFDINNSSKVVYIKWSKKLEEDYKNLADDYYRCAFLTCEEIIKNSDDNIKCDMWYLPTVYMFRQSIELALKSLICRVLIKKDQIQKSFIECKHNLSKLYEEYKKNDENYLKEEEDDWLREYLDSLESVDGKSDLFRFPFEDDFLSQYRDKFLDNVDMANNMCQCYLIISKCINKGIYEDEYTFQNKYSTEFLVFANHGFGNCYLWQSLTDSGFHKNIVGYEEVAEFLFYKCNGVSINKKVYPVIFLLRNSIELCLKRMFYKRVNNGVSKEVFSSKRRSHLLEKELWKSIKPMINYYASETKGSDSITSLVEKQIIELSKIDKNGDIFRYPTSYSFEYRFNDKYIDLENIYDFMQGICNFLDGYDDMLENISEIEAEMRLEYEPEFMNDID